MAKTREGGVKAMIKRRLLSAGFKELGKGHIESDGWFFMPVQGLDSVHGMSDFLGVWRGVAWFIEAKTGDPDSKPTAHQQDFLLMAACSLALSCVVRTEQDMDSFFEKLQSMRHVIASDVAMSPNAGFDKT
jgi:hypothetical protein